MKSGLFITLEGMDGCGKTTIGKMLYEKLLQLNYPVIFTREPGGSDIAEQIREVLLNPKNTAMDTRSEALLYAASRRQHLVEIIKPALDAHKIVLCDRYIDSSLAYQGHARLIGIDDVMHLNQFVIGSHLPDATLLFKVDVNQALERRKLRCNSDRLDLEDHRFHDLVSEGYNLVYEQFKERITLIDANKTIEEVFEQALNEVMELIGTYE